ncbi:MAG: hypothetical protein ACFNS8_05640, partial [Kingella oralis]
KTHVARNVLVECARARIQVATAALYPINARRWFNAEVDACWLAKQAAQPATPIRTFCPYSPMICTSALP